MYNTVGEDMNMTQGPKCIC